MELDALRERYDEIRAAGAELVAISPLTVANTKKVKRKLRLPFTVLSDAKNAFAEQLGLAWTLPEALQKLYGEFGTDLPTLHNDDAWRLPVSSRFVVDTSGTIRNVEADTDYMVRPEVDATLEVLKALS